MESLYSHLERCLQIVKSQPLTGIETLSEEDRQEFDNINKELLLSLTNILLSCQDAITLLNKKERLIQKNIVTRDVL